MPFTIRNLTKMQLLTLCFVVVSALTSMGISSQWLFAAKTNSEMAAAAPSAIQVGKKAIPLGKGYIDRKGIWPQLRSALDA